MLALARKNFFLQGASLLRYKFVLQIQGFAVQTCRRDGMTVYNELSADKRTSGYSIYTRRATWGASRTDFYFILSPVTSTAKPLPLISKQTCCAQLRSLYPRKYTSLICRPLLRFISLGAHSAALADHQISALHISCLAYVRFLYLVSAILLSSCLLALFLLFSLP